MLEEILETFQLKQKEITLFLFCNFTIIMDCWINWQKLQAIIFYVDHDIDFLSFGFWNKDFLMNISFDGFTGVLIW